MCSFRKIDATYISGTKLFDNYIPCVCNGDLEKGLNRSWNTRGWTLKFHIITKNLINVISVALCYSICEKEVAIVQGIITYNIKNGIIDENKSSYDVIDKNHISHDEIKEFLINVIFLFGEMNYVAKMNAINKQESNKKSKFNVNWANKKQDKEIKYEFQESFEQPPYIPKEIKAKRKNNDKKTYQSKCYGKKRNVKTIIYRVATWERAGYYTRKGIYVPPCTMKRHIK